MCCFLMKCDSWFKRKERKNKLEQKAEFAQKSLEHFQSQKKLFLFLQLFIYLISGTTKNVIV